MSIHSSHAHLSTKSKRFRFLLFVLCEAFSIGSFFYACFSGVASKILICIFSMLLLCVPHFLSKWLRFYIPTPLYVFILLYALCPMLGHAYHFYYLIPWWDTLLHTCGGVAFALLGAYLPTLFQPKRPPSLWLCAIFGFCFSCTVAVLWEFIEYGCDMLLQSDMQQDTIVSSIYSYLLGDQMGVIGSIPNIESIIINGNPLNGYIEIGLIDTMTDMIFETLGALVYTAVYYLDKGKHVSFHQNKE